VAELSDGGVVVMFELRTDKLRTHQAPPAKELLNLLRQGINCVDLSDTGTGKTYVATAVYNALQVPTLAIVPKISVPDWHSTAAAFSDTVSVVSYESLRTGRSGFGWWDNTPPPAFRCETYFKCTSCQLIVDHENFVPCFAHPLGIHCVEVKKHPWKYGRFHFHPGIKLTVWDEVHRCSAIDSLNGDMLDAAPLTLGLTATAACSPMQMNHLGKKLGLHQGGPDFYRWARRHGCGKIPGLPGFHWLKGKETQTEIMKSISAEIVPSRGVRVRYTDIPGFPERTITAKLFDIDGKEEIDRLHTEMKDALEKLENRRGSDKDCEHPLTVLTRVRQKLGLLKIPLIVERVQDWVDKGYSVGVFLNFKQEMDELRRRLKVSCFIDGSPEGQKLRQKAMEDFRADKERIILVNSEAGGIAVNLQDIRGEFPRVGEVLPCQSARTFKQLIGRFHREGAKSPCFYELLLAAGTKEIEIHKKLTSKLANLDALNDGDFLCD
jgi:hypothetical protein